jgi:fumarate reductase flavoprotein subunit
VSFDKVFLAAGQSVPRGHSRNPGEVIEILSSRAAASGRVRVMTGTPVRRLVREADGEPVLGVVAQARDRQLAIRAQRGVVLTSGGFSRNEALLKQFAPSQVGAMRAGGPGNTGDGLLMGWHLGAGMRDMGFIKGTFGGHPAAGPGQHALMLPIYVGAIAVNANGERFVDESKSYKLIGDAVIKQPDAIGYQIFDQRIFEKGNSGIPTMAFQAKYEQGQVIRAQTLAELAAKIGLPAGRLQETVEDYNRFVREGNDVQFGRNGLGTSYGALASIDAPPFYAYPSKSVIVATYCGLSVDAGMRVRDVFDNVIAGLYAAGEVIGGLHGHAYMTGSSLGKASIFGRIAARTAVAAGADPGPAVAA